jgi:hypothetical protein
MYKCNVTYNQKTSDINFTFCRIQMYDVKSLLADSGYINDTPLPSEEREIDHVYVC